MPSFPFSNDATDGKLQCAILAISHLSTSVDFYQETVGLPLLRRDAQRAEFGWTQNQPMLVLEERAGVRPIGEMSRLGLYYTGFRLPDRAALASFAEHLLCKRIRFGAADHGVAEGFYILDPDGLTVKVYCEREPSQWRITTNEVQIWMEPLDLQSLLAVPSSPWAGFPSGSRLGHLHFFIGDLKRARRLYAEGLGMLIASTTYSNALFVAARDLKDHIGLSTWARSGIIAGETDSRLLSWRLSLSPGEDLKQIKETMLRCGWEIVAGARGIALKDDWGIIIELVQE